MCLMCMRELNSSKLTHTVEGKQINVWDKFKCQQVSEEKDSGMN